MCCISLLQREADDKEGRNYTVMQTVKSKKRHSCWDERDAPASFWKVTNVGFLLLHLMSFCQQGPNCKTSEKFPNSDQFRPFSIQPFYPLKQVFGQIRVIVCFLSLFLSFSPDFIFPNVAFLPPLSSEKITEKGMLLCSVPQERRQRRKGKGCNIGLYHDYKVLELFRFE